MNHRLYECLKKEYTFHWKSNLGIFLFEFGFLVVFWQTAFKYYVMFSFKRTLLKIPESILQ